MPRSPSPKNKSLFASFFSEKEGSLARKTDLHGLDALTFLLADVRFLDGVAAGIFGVIATLIAADLMRGTGRFNPAQGLVALAIGAGLSNLLAGFIVQWFGYPVGFLALAALGFFAIFMPETRASGDGTRKPRAIDHRAA